MSIKKIIIKKICPIILDIETTGLNEKENAILEIALINTKFNKKGDILPNKKLHLHISPFNTAKINKQSIICNKIDLFNPLRFSITEQEASVYILEFIKQTLKNYNTKICTLVGHNCWFDLIFLNNLIYRNNKTNSYYHKFNIIDTATFGNIIYEKTILSKLAKKIGIKLNNKKCHSAIYDAKITALIFCNIVNKIKNLNSKFHG